MDKPPYRVPLVAETRERPKSGLTLVSTFSGAGGSCYGFEMAGYECLLASEFAPAAAETYRLNHPGVPVWEDDVREVTGARMLEQIGLGVGELDVLEGSPPCQPFSTAGRGAKGWGQLDEAGKAGKQDLFFDFSRLVGDLRPRAFIAENVSGLIRGAAKGYFKRIYADLASHGYRVKARLLDAQWLGVPQVRRRVIFVGVRDDLGRDPAFPSPLPYRYSIRDALPHFTRIGYDGGLGYNYGKRTVVEGDQPAPTVEAAGIFGDSPSGTNKYWVEAVEIDSKGMEGKRTYSPDEPLGTVRAGGGGHQTGYRVVSRKVASGEEVDGDVAATLEGYAVGDEWDKLREGESSDRFFNLVRPDSDKPLPTVTAMGTGGDRKGAPGGVASVTHPTEKRKFTIAELRRLCSFPDDYQLSGSYQQQWERLGNAVPPVMMFWIAKTLADEVLLP